MILTVFIKCDIFFDERGKLVPVLPHVGDHVPTEDPVVRVSIAQLISESSEQAVAVRMCAHVTDVADTCVDTRAAWH